MKLSDILADFQLEGTRIKSITTKNDFVILPPEEKREISIKINNSLSEIHKNERNNCYYANLILDLTATVNEIETKKFFEINIVIDGLFSFTGENKDEFNNMLLLNGNTTLYSIARANVLTISSMSFANGEIMLPMINFVKLMQQKINEENAENENE